MSYGPPRDTQNFFKEATTLTGIPYLGITWTTRPSPRCVKLPYERANIYYKRLQGHQHRVTTQRRETFHE